MKRFHGFLIVNKYKEKPDQPDVWGKITIGGSEYDIAGWYGTTKKGKAKTDLRVKLRKRESVQEKIDKQSDGRKEG